MPAVRLTTKVHPVDASAFSALGVLRVAMRKTVGFCVSKAEAAKPEGAKRKSGLAEIMS